MRGVYCDGTAIQFRRDLPAIQLQPGEVCVDVRKVGICETDVQLAQGYMNFQGVLGHEFVGRTADGRRVTAEINNSCHRCGVCQSGQAHHCPNRTVLGILDHDGAMADQVAVPERNIHLIPDEISDEQAVFIEPLAAAFRIVEQVSFAAGMNVAVVGDGKLGLLSTWVLRLAGVTLTLIGKHPAKLALGGSDVATCLLPDVSRLGRTQDVVVECTGSPTGLATALGLVRPCGTVVLKTTLAGDHALSLAPIVIDEVRIIGSRCGPFPPAIAALSSGKVDVRPLIAATYPLDQAEAAFAAAMKPGARKVLLEV